MSDPFIGEIRLVGFNFAPRGWAFANGAQLAIVQNQALFSLLGVTFGGNGTSTFGLPDYRGRMPVGMGQGPGLPNVQQGEIAGAPTVTLNVAQLPAHTVQFPQQTAPVSVTGTVAIPASSGDATTGSPANAVPGSTGRGTAIYDAAATGSDTLKPFNVTLAGSATVPAGQSTPVGSNAPISLASPYLGTNFIIALEGIYPSRS